MHIMQEHTMDDAFTLIQSGVLIIFFSLTAVCFVFCCSILLLLVVRTQEVRVHLRIKGTITIETHTDFAHSNMCYAQFLDRQF